jgi:hydroxyquinol 1,2-dioxygenase
MPYVTEENLTDVALDRWKNIPDPRLRQIMQSLIKHLHGFVRDIEPTQAEWATAIDWLTRTGKLCSEKRQEFILTSDVLGVSMLVDAINHRQRGGGTPTTVEGPFHVLNAPPIENGGNMAKGAPGIPCFVTGRVRGLDGEPVGGAVLDLWQTDGEGLYEDQRGTQGPYMRGLYESQADGSYAIRTVAPISYTIPMDGTVGELMNRTKISHMRPAHIHFAITAPPCGGLPWPGDASLPEGRRVHRAGCRLRREGAADRGFRQAPPRQSPERRDDRPAVLRGAVRLRAPAEGFSSGGGGVTREQDRSPDEYRAGRMSGYVQWHKADLPCANCDVRLSH